MQQKPIELDILTLIIAFSAFILSVINFYISRQQESKTRKDSVIKALQGEKESVAYVAYKIINDEWKKELKEGKFRDDVITSLCLSWALESSV